jgi:hypothetical protein
LYERRGRKESFQEGAERLTERRDRSRNSEGEIKGKREGMEARLVKAGFTD